jgi:hypothetical protein
VPEISEACPGTPWVLVGMQTDLRDGSDEEAERCRRDRERSEFQGKFNVPVSKDEGRKMARKLGASAYVECSARMGDKNGGDVKRVFEEVCYHPCDLDVAFCLICEGNELTQFDTIGDSCFPAAEAGDQEGEALCDYIGWRLHSLIIQSIFLVCSVLGIGGLLIHDLQVQVYPSQPRQHREKEEIQ